MATFTPGQTVTLTLDYDDYVTFSGAGNMTVTPYSGSSWQTYLTGNQVIGPFKTQSTSVSIACTSDGTYTQASATDVNAGARIFTSTAGGVSIVAQDGSLLSTLGSKAITVGAGGQYADIQSAINSITDNLPVSYNAGTVSVTNGSAQITFSSAPAADKVVAGRDLFTVDGSRYYQIKSGPTVSGGTIFNLLEVYQGTTNATAAFSVIKPNPRTVLLLPGVYDYSSVTLAENILLKPYVGITGVDRNSCVIRRNLNNSSPDTTPVVGITHGSWLRNVTIDAADGHFMTWRMGLTAVATSQTQAMAGSRWLLDNVAIINKDPNGIDSGSDIVLDAGYYNGDDLIFNNCYFEHCWDGFTWETLGGRLNVLFKNPVIYKTPYPLGKTVSGCTFIRAGVNGASTADVVMLNPYYNQSEYAAGEVMNAVASTIRAAGTNGMLMVGSGATGKVINPTIDMDVGLNKGRNAPIGLFGAATGASTLQCIGGVIKIAGAGGGNAADHVDGAFNDYAQGTLTVSGTNIDAGISAVRQNAVGAVTNLQGGARLKGATNSIVNTAGTMNQSANVSLAAVASSGVITSAET